VRGIDEQVAKATKAVAGLAREAEPLHRPRRRGQGRSAGPAQSPTSTASLLLSPRRTATRASWQSRRPTTNEIYSRRQLTCALAFAIHIAGWWLKGCWLACGCELVFRAVEGEKHVHLMGEGRSAAAVLRILSA
jgi:hypothetical protein